MSALITLFLVLAVILLVLPSPLALAEAEERSQQHLQVIQHLVDMQDVLEREVPVQNQCLNGQSMSANDILTESDSLDQTAMNRRICGSFLAGVMLGGLIIGQLARRHRKAEH
jgi:hypothetical protein